MARPNVHLIFNNVAAAAGNFPSAAGVENRETEGEPGTTVAVDIFVTGTVTGTTPSMTVSIQVSVDGVNWIQVAAGAAITAPGSQRVTASNIVEPWVRVVVAITGTTPVFNGVVAHLVIG